MDLQSMNLTELEELVEKLGEKKFRAQQIFEWINKKGIQDFAQMSNISLSFRQKLEQETFLSGVSLVQKFDSKFGNSIKYLFSLKDGNIIESVLMKHNYGNSVCISSQVGCKMNCSFCSSGYNGFVRNLFAGEMVSQVYQIRKIEDIQISSIVIMGSGEPLDNFENTMKFIELINSKNGLNIGQRHITLSTCGLVDKIYSLAKRNMQINLAISLHAPNDEIRKQIMPIAKAFAINEVINSCKYYVNVTHRRLTFEYVMINGINDSRENALELAHKLKGLCCYVNLIPLNDSQNHSLSQSNGKIIDEFAKVLKSHGIEVVIRKSLGSDVNAACGQLKNSFINNTITKTNK